MPLSEDALAFARRLAATKYRYPDDRLAVADLLERWNLGLGTTPAERRMALRLSREQVALHLPDTADEASAPLPAARPAPEGAGGGNTAAARGEEVAALEGDDETEEDFYADALDDV
ncbi:hypothetical protein [Streptomyces roseifaciens]|uniref:hypothetical protein n=1 Tax=Streptomyces roseifaciens TaxID=1488406 RepID=UPI001FDEC978|nr:hypothetical protein [Streptomyces roseifaciens]